jgi:BirA family transcriptional regulator, biotin operon repressor / biotin---[acetyl-CoA-carboxylase] ligase
MTGGRAHPGPSDSLGYPRLHLRRTDSTNERARELALAGAPHGTLVSAAEQTAGRGRQGRAWVTPPGSALLCSLVLRNPPALLSLLAGVAVCDAVGERALVKWPNDVVVLADAARTTMPAAADRPTMPADADRTPGGAPEPGASPEPTLAKLAGILVEGRPQEGWAVLGIGLNVAVRVERLPPDVRERAASLEREPSALEPLLADLLGALEQRLAQPAETVLDAWRARDALRGREVSWAHPKSTYPEGTRRQGRGQAEGIDEAGHLLVRLGDGTTAALSAGEVHLESVG